MESHPSHNTPSVSSSVKSFIVCVLAACLAIPMIHIEDNFDDTVKIDHSHQLAHHSSDQHHAQWVDTVPVMHTALARYPSDEVQFSSHDVSSGRMEHK